MSFCLRKTKKGQLAFPKRQQQRVNSGNNISSPRIFLKVESSAILSEQTDFSYRLKISLYIAPKSKTFIK